MYMVFGLMWALERSLPNGSACLGYQQAVGAVHLWSTLQLWNRAVLYVSFDFHITDTPLAYNILHLLTALVSLAVVVMKFPNFQLAE